MPSAAAAATAASTAASAAIFVFPVYGFVSHTRPTTLTPPARNNSSYSLHDVQKKVHLSLFSSLRLPTCHIMLLSKVPSAEAGELERTWGEGKKGTLYAFPG